MRRHHRRALQDEFPEMLRAINEYGVTYLPLMPPILVAMVAHP